MTGEIEDVSPDLSTIKLFEREGTRFRIYLTHSGTITCERFDAQAAAWKHIPLRQASERDVTEMLAARYASADEEIARAVASCRG